MKYWSCVAADGDGDSFFGLCSSLRPNVFLRGYGDYKSSFKYSLCGEDVSRVNLGRFCGR